MAGTRVSLRGRRAVPRAAVPLVRAAFLLPDGLRCFRRLAEAGCVDDDLGFSGDGCLGGGGVRELRACFLRARGEWRCRPGMFRVCSAARAAASAAAATASSDDVAVTWEVAMAARPPPGSRGM